MPTGTIRFPFSEPPPEGGAREVAEGIFWINMPLPRAFGLASVNSYALDDGDSWTLVDTGIASRRSRDIWRALLSGPLLGKPVKRLVVTHHHPDHIGLAGWFQSEFGATLVTTRTAWLFARMLTLDEQDRPVPETIAYWKAAGMAPEILKQRQNQRPFNFSDLVAPMPLGFQQISEGSKIEAGGRRWTVRLGQGHAPDHATLWSEDSDIVIAGDQFLPTISPNIGVYATEPEADPLKDWLAATERLAAHATDAQLVLHGHKLPYSGLPARLKQLAENHHGALARLTEHLAQPRTAADCFQPLFKREVSPGEYGLALVEAMAHVLHLWHQGQITREVTKDGRWLWQRSS